MDLVGVVRDGAAEFRLSHWIESWPRHRGAAGSEVIPDLDPESGGDPVEDGMETALQIAGVMVPSFAALGGLFAWGVRRLDRRFEEARQERARIEAKFDSRCDGIEAKFDARCDGIEAKFDARCDEMEAKFEERWSRLEEKIDRLGDRLEERSDRVAEQLSGQITELNREVGKLQGITGVARILDIASH